MADDWAIMNNSYQALRSENNEISEVMIGQAWFTRGNATLNQFPQYSSCVLLCSSLDQIPRENKIDCIFTTSIEVVARTEDRLEQAQNVCQQSVRQVLK